MLDVAQTLLPDARQLAALKQLLVYGVYQLDTRSRSHEVLALASYVVALEESLYYSGTRRRSANAVLLKGGSQSFVLNKLACGLHGTQQGSLCIILRWRCPLLG